MAAVAEGGIKPGIYWINDHDDQPTVIVPGVSKKMGQRSEYINGRDGMAKSKASSDTKGRSGKKSSLPLSLLATESHIVNAPFQKTADFLAKPKATAQGPTSIKVLPNLPQTKSKTSLKDLCPEDKRRVANLIEELARVSEEKEESVQRLKDEQETFEKKIQQLEHQNVLIIQERESLRQQYRECQELLGLYQQYLSQQQEKLNKSIAQLNQSRSHCKMAGSERAPSSRRVGGGRGASMDGSYLNLPSSGSRGSQGWPEGCSHSVLGRPQNGPISAPSSCSGQDCCRCDGRTAGASKKEQRDSNAAARPHSAKEPRGLGRGLGLKNDSNCGVELNEMMPPPGRQDWEEKRHHLLLQKKQLEVERERLQARLAQQEERLQKQNQELRQSRLDYSRLQQASTVELEKSTTGAGRSKDCLPTDTAVANSDGKVGGLQAVQGCLKEPLNDAHPQECKRNIQLPEPVLSQERPVITKKDMATSPVQSQILQKSSKTPPSTLPHNHSRKPETPRLDSSLIELLDIFSPITNPARSRISPSSKRILTAPRRPPSTVPPRPHRSALLPPPSQKQTSHQDLEESQILEDIFFIC